MLDDSTSCFLSWNGHYLKYYIPENYVYLRDYGVVAVPTINFENSIVGIGDNVVLTKNNDSSKEVVSAILSSNFGETWSSYENSEFISANKYFDKNFNLVSPNKSLQKNSVNKSIKLVKMGKIKEAEKAIRPAVSYLMKIKCKKIILGCTELPIAIFAYKSFKKIKQSKVFVDPNLLLANISMKKYKRF